MVAQDVQSSCISHGIVSFSACVFVHFMQIPFLTGEPVSNQQQLQISNNTRLRVPGAPPNKAEDHLHLICSSCEEEGTYTFSFFLPHRVS